MILNPSAQFFRLITLVGMVTLTGVACHETSAPKIPSAVELGTSLPSATAGLTLSTSPTFTVKDASGETLSGIAVSVTVTAGGGTLVDVPTKTSSIGTTPIGTWTLGRSAGINTVTVTVANLPPLTISVLGVAGPPASVAIASGNAQSAAAGTLLPQQIVAGVRDQFGNGVANVAMTFAVTAGGGTLTPTSGTTDASGNVSGITWRLGKSAVPQTANASSSGFNTAMTATVATNYNVDLRFFGPTPVPEAMAAFNEAAARIRAVVVGDVPDFNVPASTGGAGFNLGQRCGVSGVILNEIVDDVVIYATVTPIDGPGNILASAGPCLIRSETGFSLVGVMRFDADDISNLFSSNRLNAVVLHEMMHVVGVGTLWNARSLLKAGGTPDPRFSGTLGVIACTEAGGANTCATGIPVENVGGSGSVDAHWRESILDTELMTSFAEATGVPMPLSNITIQSLADEGYVVNPAAADAYTLPAGFNSRALRSSVSSNEEAAWDIVLLPQFGISSNGAIRQLVITR